ncbi:FMN-binding glutamate synthase family protein [Teredinibacter haidensis]|uniref:FMN-binding glutamate synthase family protein n=1 Tax=Teredinibacter haidensis TaxID=2731755 RepID=UPI000948FE73|nr:FMN-binding glutamate synthase family protein [Teredinibacter haidensis]
MEASLHSLLSLLTFIFVLAVGLGAAYALILFFVDINQSKSAIRRNYPVIGRFRYLFEHLGEFFRQYFFALDREEMPFNRAVRTWVYRAAKDVSTELAFGSTRNDTNVGDHHFVNSVFPVLEEEKSCSTPIEFGPYCKTPYRAKSFFNISGMSFGALSKPAVRALAGGAASAGCWINTGEGGVSPYHLEGGADVVVQIGTAKYGVRNERGELSVSKLKALAEKPNIRMFEIKLSQGAKPGKGGILPAEKVTAEIAAIRGIPEGEASISPNRHPEINNTQQLLDMVNRVRDLTGKPTGIKLVMGDPAWLIELCDVIHARGIEQAPDFITLDSSDGGSGAAPQPLMDYVGLPLRESLPLLVDILNEHNLKQRIRVIASGKLVTPGYAAEALATGADAIVSARGFMFALGCIQAMQCNKNTCPTGITTHDTRLQRGLNVEDKAWRVANYQKKIVHDVEMIAHSCGVNQPSDLERKHVRLVTENGRSVSMAELYERR